MPTHLLEAEGTQEVETLEVVMQTHLLVGMILVAVGTLVVETWVAPLPAMLVETWEAMREQTLEPKIPQQENLPQKIPSTQMLRAIPSPSTTSM